MNVNKILTVLADLRFSGKIFPPTQRVFFLSQIEHLETEDVARCSGCNAQ